MEKKTERFPADILFVGTYPPIRCGIATFTKDLSSASQKALSPFIGSKILVVSSNNKDIDFPKEVMFKLDKESLEEYKELAKEINEKEQIKLVCIQHEYGIFGGEYGTYLINFLKYLDKPVIVTLHTVKNDPSEIRKRITQDMEKYSDAFIVLIDKSKKVLEKQYEIDPDKIFVIPHGVHHVDFIHPPKEKKFFKTKDKIILSTFGLLGSKTKGLDYVIEALPSVIKEYPNIMYVILGQIHPYIIEEGEDYTHKLKEKIKKLGLKDYVRFHVKYLTLKNLLAALVETDIYLTAFVEKDRKSSGTLSYAMGCGRACISTPFYFAEDLIEHEKNGLIVNFKSSKEFADAIKKILRSPEFKKRLEKKAYEKTRYMVWEKVARDYYKIYQNIIK